MTASARSVGSAVVAAFLAVATIVLPGTPARAQATHVAVIVDFGSRGGVTSHCSPGGGSGFAVLEDGYSVRTNKTGLVAWIDSVGNDNPPLNLYWSYWHWSGSHWSYASTGPASYTPAAGSVEGWVYGDGKSAPPSSSYSSICAGQDPVPPPRPSTPTSRPTPPTTPGSTRPANAPSPPATSTTSRVGGGSGEAKSAGSGASSPPAAHGATSRSSGAANGGGAPTASTDAAGPSTAVANALPAAPPKAAQDKQSGIPPWGTALAILAVAALAGTAFWLARRRTLP